MHNIDAILATFMTLQAHRGLRVHMCPQDHILIPDMGLQEDGAWCL